VYDIGRFAYPVVNCVEATNRAGGRRRDGLVPAVMHAFRDIRLCFARALTGPLAMLAACSSSSSSTPAPAPTPMPTSSTTTSPDTPSPGQTPAPGSTDPGTTPQASCSPAGTFGCGGNVATCHRKDEYCDIGDHNWEGALGYPYICASLPSGATGACKDCSWLLANVSCLQGGTPTCTGSQESGFTVTCK
jgi:hypothetical protein